MTLGFNTSVGAPAADGRLTLQELIDGLSDPLSLLAVPDLVPVSGTDFGGVDVTVGLSGGSVDFSSLTGDLLGSTPNASAQSRFLAEVTTLVSAFAYCSSALRTTRPPPPLHV